MLAKFAETNIEVGGLEVGGRMLTGEIKIKLLERDHSSDGDWKEISQRIKRKVQAGERRQSRKFGWNRGYLIERHVQESETCWKEQSEAGCAQTTKKLKLLTRHSTKRRWYAVQFVACKAELFDSCTATFLF